MGNSKTLSQLLFAFSRPLEQAPIRCLSKYFLAEFLMNKFSLCLCPIATRIQLEIKYKLYCQLFYNRDQTALLSFSHLYENKTQKTLADIHIFLDAPQQNTRETGKNHGCQTSQKTGWLQKNTPRNQVIYYIYSTSRILCSAHVRVS